MAKRESVHQRTLTSTRTCWIWRLMPHGPSAESWPQLGRPARLDPEIHLLACVRVADVITSPLARSVRSHELAEAWEYAESVNLQTNFVDGCYSPPESNKGDYWIPSTGPRASSLILRSVFLSGGAPCDRSAIASEPQGSRVVGSPVNAKCNPWKDATIKIPPLYTFPLRQARARAVQRYNEPFPFDSCRANPTLSAQPGGVREPTGALPLRVPPALHVRNSAIRHTPPASPRPSSSSLESFLKYGFQPSLIRVGEQP